MPALPVNAWLSLGLCLSLLLLALVGCSHKVSPGALLVVLAPRTPQAPAPARNALDLRYPNGSRLVCLEPPFGANHVRVLSTGLSAAGAPVMSYDGKSVFFAGKKTPTNDWQVYAVPLEGRAAPQALTAMAGGAMEPALLPDGRLLFVSPVPLMDATNSPAQPSALYAQAPEGKPQRLTFGPENATEPTLLADGRILFVSALPPRHDRTARGASLYTVNNDGTELTAFAGQQEPGVAIERPRQLPGGRIAFVVKDTPNLPGGRATYVESARPFAGTRPLFSVGTPGTRAVQPTRQGELLVCAAHGSSVAPPQAWGLFRIPATATALSTPLFTFPGADVLEAIEAAAPRPPMGRVSSVDANKRTGQMLCLNANDSTYCAADGQVIPAVRIRVLAKGERGTPRALGEVPVQADGSFMAEVPADTPLGFEALDAQGQVLRRLDPMVWVRPGENRSCVGCHAAPNRAPHNQRPLATRLAVPRL
jgi:hypothetical protein